MHNLILEILSFLHKSYLLFVEHHHMPLYIYDNAITDTVSLWCVVSSYLNRRSLCGHSENVNRLRTNPSSNSCRLVFACLAMITKIFTLIVETGFSAKLMIIIMFYRWKHIDGLENKICMRKRIAWYILKMFNSKQNLLLCR